jgi:xanthine dehydrogenase accessory factor
MSPGPRPLVIVRGGGDLASGVAVRLQRAGFGVLVLEVERPLALRRLVAFAEAIYAGQVVIEGLMGRRIEGGDEADGVIAAGGIPVLVDPQNRASQSLQPAAIVDGRMLKRLTESRPGAGPLLIGLGPGFVAGLDCDVVIETNRGHHMGRVYWQGSAEADTRLPEPIFGHEADRVIRAPASGVLKSHAELASLLEQGDLIATVDGSEIRAAFDGALRGLMHDGLPVEAKMKIGDLDPRQQPSYCREVSDKALAVGGGVLEALLTMPRIRAGLGG